jgi:5-methylcytosine-specific restriction protein B
MMVVEQQRILELVSLLQRRYPQWQSFADPRFVQDEISYKQATIAKARELLSEGELKDLLETDRFDEFDQRLETLGQDNNLLWRRVPTNGDLGILYHPDLDKPTFCLAVFDLLYGPGDSPARLGRYVNYVRAYRLPNKWTFPTYFLYICHPETELYVKPATIKWLLQFFGASDIWSNGPTPQAYATILRIAGDIRDGLKQYDTQDMVDIQSLIWVAASAVSSTDYAFSPQAFKLLERLQSNSTKTTYQTRKDEFKKHVEQPFQSLVFEVANALPEAITERLETRNRIFSSMLKNELGQGRAWGHYWAAFYPKGTGKSDGAQLLLFINADGLEFGFNLGRRGQQCWKRFVRNCEMHRAALGRLLDGVAGDGARGKAIAGFDCEKLGEADRVTVVLPRQAVMQNTSEQLVAVITDTFLRVFPLVLLATEDEPLSAIREYLSTISLPRPGYTLAQCATATGMDEALLARWVSAIERKGQAILYGPPGTGKTYLAEHLARHLTAASDGFWELVQFHPAYAYEDFIQGIRPQTRADGSLEYPLVPGRFLEFCARAEKRQGRCVLMIDEINRADLARVFGELMFLMEYREQSVPLAGGKTFRVPANVRIIGTMNTANRSIALIDHALRRRFAFLSLQPDYEVLRHYHGRTGFPVEGLIEVLERLNRHIGDPHYAVGITFFLVEEPVRHLEEIWRLEIEPYLEEYFFDQPEQAELFLWENVQQAILPSAAS